MATLRKLRQQIFSFNITAAGGAVGGDFTMDQEIDRNFRRTISLSVEVNDARSLTGGTFDTPLTIDSQEVLTAGYELKRLFSTTSVGPMCRKYKINERANGAKLKFKYLDGGGFVITGAYTVKVYLDLSNDEKDEPDYQHK
jgi:hypothetical protein